MTDTLEQPTLLDGACTGSYKDSAPHSVLHGKRRVTGACPVCGKRVAFVTAYGLPNYPRVLGRHTAPKGN